MLLTADQNSVKASRSLPLLSQQALSAKLAQTGRLPPYRPI